MARYPSILLAGEMRFSSFFIRELEKALLSGSDYWIHSEATAQVILKPNLSSAVTGEPREWVTDTALTRNAEGLILVTIPPGESRFVFLPTAKVGGKQAP